MSYIDRLKKIIFPVFALMAVVLFTVPLDSIINNQKYLVITPGMVWPILLFLVCSVTVFLSLFVALFQGRVYFILKGLVCGSLLAIFIQLLFLNSSLGTLNGSEPDWVSMNTEILIGLILWGLAILGNVILAVFLKDKYKTIVMGLCIAVLAAQFTSLLSGILTSTGETKYTEEYVLNGKDQFTVSEEGNIILFSLDYFSKDLFDEILEEYPETREEYKDFTYYQNVCGAYDYTFPALCHLYTGTEYTGDIETFSYFEKAWNSDKANQFYDALHKNGFEVNLYTDINYVAGYGKNLLGKADNLTPGEPKMTVGAMIRLIKLSLYRVLPTALKRHVLLSTDDLNEKIEYICANNELYEPLKVDDSFLDYLLENRLTIREEGKIYSCQHLLGAHVPHTTDEYGNPCEDSTDIRQCRGYLYAISKYLEQMKEAGVYDKSLVIITADHGSYPSYFVPVLMKEMNQSKDEMIISDIPATQNDIIPTIAEQIGENSSKYGTSFSTLSEEMVRERVFRRFEILEGYEGTKWIGSIGQLNMQKDWGAHHNVLLEYRFVGNQDILKEMVEKDQYEVRKLKDSFY